MIDKAATGRSKCRGCGAKIAAGELRFGETLPNPFADGDTTQWFHTDCGAYKRPEPFLETLAAHTEALPDRERLESEARRGVEHPRLVRINGAERAASGRAQCRHCKETIPKDAWRITMVFWEEGRFMPSGFVHAACVQPYFETADVLPRVKRFSPGLTAADLDALVAEIAVPKA